MSIPRKALPALDDLRAVKRALMESRGVSVASDHFNMDLRLSLDQLNILNELIDSILDDRDPRAKYWELKGRPKNSDARAVLKELFAVIVMLGAKTNGILTQDLIDKVMTETGLTYDQVRHAHRHLRELQREVAEPHLEKDQGKK